MTRTDGISPKAKLAGLLPAISAILAITVQWAVTGEYDRAELVTSLTGLASSAVAFLGAYLGAPGAVTEVPASDDLLPVDVQKKLRED